MPAWFWIKGEKQFSRRRARGAEADEHLQTMRTFKTQKLKENESLKMNKRQTFLAKMTHRWQIST